MKVKVTFISISPLFSRVKVPHTSNADAVSRLTWIRKADHFIIMNMITMMVMMIVMMITGIMNFDDDGHDEDDVEEDTYAGHMFQALKPC